METHTTDQELRRCKIVKTFPTLKALMNNMYVLRFFFVIGACTNSFLVRETNHNSRSSSICKTLRPIRNSKRTKLNGFYAN